MQRLEKEKRAQIEEITELSAQVLQPDNSNKDFSLFCKASTAIAWHAMNDWCLAEMSWRLTCRQCR